MKFVEIFCDGSSLGNPGYGGYCAILRYQRIEGCVEKIVCGARKDVTNNQMELLAVIEALKVLKSPCQIKLVSDSRYVCDGIAKWIFNWVKKDFKGVKNPDLWKEYLLLSSKHKICPEWVKGHSSHIENEKCDTIAREQATKLKEDDAKA